jgi:hypothetical protein
LRRWECRDMHVKIDEDLPKSVVDLLRAEGCQATSVRAQGLQGIKDSDFGRWFNKTELLRSVISAVRLQDLAGLLAVATPRGLRVRRAAP